MAKKKPNLIFLGKFGKTLTPSVRKKLLDHLRMRKADLVEKGVKIEDAVKTSPIVKAMMEQAILEVEQAQQAHIQSIEQNIIDHFGGDKEAFFQNRADKELEIERQKFNLIISEMYSKVRQLTMDLQNGWPNKLSTRGKNKNEIVNALDSLRMKTEGVMDSLTQQENLLTLYKTELALDESAAGKVALHTATLEAAIDSTQAMIIELGKIQDPLVESISVVRKGRPFFAGKVIDKYLIPKVLVTSALSIYDSIVSISASISSLPDQMKILMPQDKIGGNLGRFFERVTEEASLEPGIYAIKVHMDAVQMRDSGTSKKIQWNKVHSEPLDLPEVKTPKRPSRSTIKNKINKYRERKQQVSPKEWKTYWNEGPKKDLIALEAGHGDPDVRSKWYAGWKPKDFRRLIEGVEKK